MTEETPKSQFGATRTFEQLLRQSAKEIIKGSSKKEFFQNLAKKGTAKVIKSGLAKSGLPDYVSDGIGDQYTVAYELVLAAGKGRIPARKLAEILTSKGLGMAKLANGNHRLTCAISIGYVAVSISKAAGALLATEGTVGVAGGATLVEVGSLMTDIYRMDTDCGISTAVKDKVDRVTLPFAAWLQNGVMQAVGRGSL